MSERQRLCFFIDGLQQWVATELWRREPHDLASTMVIVERLGDFKQRERPRSPRHERAKDGGDDRSKSGSPKATDDERNGDEGRHRHHKGEKKHGESHKQGDSRDHKAHGGLRRECFYCACPHYGKDCPHKGKMIAFLEKHKNSKGDSFRSDGEARIGALQMVNAFVQNRAEEKSTATAVFLVEISRRCNLRASIHLGAPSPISRRPPRGNPSVPEIETQIEIPIDKLFVPPETDVLSPTTSLSTRILKRSSSVLSKYARDAQVAQAEFVKSSVRTEDCPAEG
ncbi:hypothetical protein RJ640_015013 [Escallonia rubra]|uniref:Uncharacterized protein n=1 Tax=Escallonia rubra TaxID=112253 RepID=A0AA88UF71_9ASTE|nr:hypothetical protein RJ640_015013 [Escallonia rubra]